MTELGPQARELLDAGRESLSPAAGKKAQLLGQIEARAVESVSAAGSASSTVGTGKLLIGLALLAGIGGGLWLGLKGESVGGKGKGNAAQPVAVRSDVVAPSASESETPLPVTPIKTAAKAFARAQENPALDPASPPVEPQTSEDSTARRKRNNRTAHPGAGKQGSGEAHSSADSLLEERRLLSQAQASMRVGDYSAALATLQTHARRFPKGILAPERQAAQAISHCQAGQLDCGQRLAKRFVKRQGSSPLVSRVMTNCKLAE